MRRAHDARQRLERVSVVAALLDGRSRFRIPARCRRGQPCTCIAVLCRVHAWACPLPSLRARGAASRRARDVASPPSPFAVEACTAARTCSARRVRRAAGRSLWCTYRWQDQASGPRRRRWKRAPRACSTPERARRRSPSRRAHARLRAQARLQLRGGARRCDARRATAGAAGRRRAGRAALRGGPQPCARGHGRGGLCARAGRAAVVGVRRTTTRRRQRARR